MRVSLIELLLEKEVAHPTRFVETVLVSQRLQLKVAGCPWWDEAADQDKDHEMELVFEGIEEGILSLADFSAGDDEALSDFEVVFRSDVPWASRSVAAIYCETPIPKPLDIYMAVQDYLSSYCAFRSASHYFNLVDTMSLEWFVKLTQEKSFLLGKFPAEIRDLVSEHLTQQQVSFSEVAMSTEAGDDAAAKQLMVMIRTSQFFCESADAVFED